MFLNPVQILKTGAEEERGETARLSAFVGAIAIGDLVKTTLGPKGMDKILMSGEPGRESVTVTNDGATILKSIGVDNPASKVLVDMSMSQDHEVGDGTTSVTVLAAELLREAEKMVDQKMHPQTIIAGWRHATQVALEALDREASEPVTDEKQLYNELMQIAKTVLSSKILGQHSDHFAKLAVDAVIRLKGSGDLDAIQILKKHGGTLTNSYLDDGFLLEKKPGMNQPQRIENARILIANTPMDSDKVKVFGTRVRVDTVAKVAELEAAEKEKMAEKVRKICAHNINVFINRQLIYNYPEQLFADNNVMAIEHADFEGIDRLAKVLGGDVVSTFDTPDKVKLGSCKLIEQVFIGEDRVLKFSGVPLGEACTIVIRGATQQILDEAERSLHDALCVLTTHLKESRILCGGGAAEMAAAVACRRAAAQLPGKQSLAVDAYARALSQLPTILADNAGLDSAELVSQLRAQHDAAQQNKTKCYAGIDLRTGQVSDMRKLGIIESYRVKRSMVAAASEAAEMILRVDDVIKSAPRPRTADRRPC